MPTLQQIEEIIKTISSLPLKDALTFLAAQKVFSFAESGLIKIKKIIQDKHNEGKYAFVPNKEEANLLFGFSKESAYKQVELLIPKYRYIDVIRTGLLINFYHKRNARGDSIRVGEIKKYICRRPNGIKLLKIVNLPTTPFFNTVLTYLFDLKSKGYSEGAIEEIFDSIVNDWEADSKFVKSGDKITEITNFCKTKAEQCKSPFFILGMLNASQKVENAITALEKRGFFKKYRYYKKITKSTEGNQPRTEAIFVKED